MNILIAASECTPYIKTGGLADVAGALAKYLKKQNHDVRVIMPKYRAIDGIKYNLQTLPYRLSVRVGAETEDFRLKYTKTPEGIEIYFVENMRYFNRPGIYGDKHGDYGDNRERFIFFSRAVLESLKAIMFRPDVIHCHDWQTGLIPAYLKTVYSNDGFYWDTASVYTIHNIAYQGNFPADTVVMGGFNWEEDFIPAKLEYYNNVNFMKAGISFADTVSTVSPTYAREIMFESGGRGMEVALNARKDEIAGILNGIDYDYWNPETDKALAANYSKYALEGKAKCKKDLQKQAKLHVKADAFLLGCVSRIDGQKGLDMVSDAVRALAGEKDIQFVLLGTGDPYIQGDLEYISSKFHGRFSGNFEFDENLAHKIYAGCDAFLMPSRFEPCGLSQMISLAYGTIPLVNATGGLIDTVFDFDASTEGNGFIFDASRESFADLILRAHNRYTDKSSWKNIMLNAFESNYSWYQSIKQYEALFEGALKKKRRFSLYRV
ncbi:MAG: glycogen synthase [Elusimicrobia bacterium]|nr:glycogen synthase [Elusimicrobiota bacterium]